MGREVDSALRAPSPLRTCMFNRWNCLSFKFLRMYHRRQCIFNEGNGAVTQFKAFQASALLFSPGTAETKKLEIKEAFLAILSICFPSRQYHFAEHGLS